MHTETSILIKADVAKIYDLAAGVERWPSLLPHYRSVRVLEDGPRGRLVAMAARRDWFPVSWQARQECFPEVPRITFQHVRGPTAGMDVEWSFTPTVEGVLVNIRHDLHLRWPLIGRFAADRVIGPFFISNIAGKTLRRIKALAEEGGS